MTISRWRLRPIYIQDGCTTKRARRHAADKGAVEAEHAAVLAYLQFLSCWKKMQLQLQLMKHLVLLLELLIVPVGKYLLVWHESSGNCEITPKRSEHWSSHCEYSQLNKE